MNAISSMSFTNDNSHSAHTVERASTLSLGLGPNQLTWLRRNIDSFKYAEEQRAQLRHDAVRAARLAGLI